MLFSNCLLLEDIILKDHTVSSHLHHLMQFKEKKKRPLNIVNTAWLCLLVTPLQAMEKEPRKQFVYYKQVSPRGDSWNHAVGEDNHGTEMVGNFICSTWWSQWHHAGQLLLSQQVSEVKTPLWVAALQAKYSGQIETVSTAETPAAFSLGVLLFQLCTRHTCDKIGMSLASRQLNYWEWKKCQLQIKKGRKSARETGYAEEAWSEQILQTSTPGSKGKIMSGNNPHANSLLVFQGCWTFNNFITFFSSGNVSSYFSDL